LFGIVGSRSVDEAGARVAADVARHAVGQGFGVVSGGAKGVDRLAMNAAIEAGGSVVGVLADSLSRAARDADTRRAITDGRLCLCTPYKPSGGFSAASAMGRNKIIYALSDATLVVAADDGTGGTWAGAGEALRHDYSPVLVWSGDGSGDGNRKLVELGAGPVTSLEELVVPEPTPKKSEQLVMDV
jgi:predicted Rossmann fold nucleotide-binding protein DprA/Smf involved in DNA uptake